MEPIEIHIKMKNSEKSMTHKFLIYEQVTASSTDPIIMQCVKEAKESFKDEIEKIKITIKLLD